MQYDDKNRYKNILNFVLENWLILTFMSIARISVKQYI
jgi:hypothetical protein